MPTATIVLDRVSCGACKIKGDPVRGGGAVQLGDLHDEMIHRGQPTAIIVPVLVRAA